MERNIEKNNQMLLRHFQDLSRAASERNHKTYTDFLNLDELSLLQAHAREFSAPFLLFGGRELSERQVACFLPEWADQEEASFPVSCIRVSLPGSKFAAKPLSHRDYLGALLGLGIDRSKLGDIIVEDEGAYFFCISNIASFLLEELRQVGRQSVVCQLVEADTERAMEARQEEIRATVSSCRLDAVVGAAFWLSRKLSQELIESGRVYVNARQTLHSHDTLKEEDIISVRGYGKFLYAGEIYHTRGRI